VTFIKKDGSERTMLVQPATGKFNVKGAEASPERQEANRKYAENNPHLLRVWDVDRDAFRAINLNTVTRIAANGEVHEYESD
jgi:hypothetical protein